MQARRSNLPRLAVAPAPVILLLGAVLGLFSLCAQLAEATPSRLHQPWSDRRAGPRGPRRFQNPYAGEPATGPDGCTYCHCKKVYLDVGTNIGVQIRKLYEPEKFKDSPVIRIYDRVFGAGDRRSVCAFGFEPNPTHTEELNKIQEAYEMLGYPVKIFTRTAVSDYAGTAAFNLDNQVENNQWGASLYHRPGRAAGKTVVKTLNLPKFITEHLSKDATIVMKMDIEGAEFQVVPDLVLLGALCHLNTVFIEWHDSIVPNAWPEWENGEFHSRHINGMLRAMARRSKACPVSIINFDDEMYHQSDTSKVPLPEIPLPAEP